MIHNKLNYQIGKNCSIHSQSFLGYKENGKGKIIIKNKVRIERGSIIRTCGGIIKIGNNTTIGYYIIIHAMGGVIIGDNVMISPNVHIYSQNHGIQKNKNMNIQKQMAKGILIENDVWIGANSVILDGVRIGIGVVVGAGSVVTKSIPDYEIWAGNVAKKIGIRK